MGKQVAKIPTEAEQRLSKLVAKAQSQQAYVDDLTNTLKEANADLRRLLELDIPELMDELGYEAIDTNEYKLSIKDVMTASVPADKKQAVCAWLAAHGLSSLVSNEVKLAFKPDEQKLFDKTIAYIAKQTAIADRITTAQAVNTSSMKKAVKELLEQGADVDLELLGVSVIRQATIKPKEKL